MFGPTTRPSEPQTAGLAVGPGATPANLMPADPLELLRAIVSVYPDPYLVNLLTQHG